jgi:hypothetical protein
MDHTRNVDETGFCRIKTKDAYSEAHLPRPNVQPMETSMQKTVLTILSALLISGLAVQLATAASEKHKKFRRAYDQLNGPVVVTPPARYNWDTNGFGFGGRDPSRVGGEDPDLRPSGS